MCPNIVSPNVSKCVIYIVIVEFIYVKASLNSKEREEVAVINTMTRNKRKHLRFELPVDVKLTTKNGNEVILKSQDISDGGIFLRVDKMDFPNIGEEVVIQLASMVAGDEPREINATIVRHNDEGIGIEFRLDDDE